MSCMILSAILCNYIPFLYIKKKLITGILDDYSVLFPLSLSLSRSPSELFISRFCVDDFAALERG